MTRKPQWDILRTVFSFVYDNLLLLQNISQLMKNFSNIMTVLNSVSTSHKNREKLIKIFIGFQAAVVSTYSTRLSTLVWIENLRDHPVVMLKQLWLNWWNFSCKKEGMRLNIAFFYFCELGWSSFLFMIRTFFVHFRTKALSLFFSLIPLSKTLEIMIQRVIVQSRFSSML